MTLAQARKIAFEWQAKLQLTHWALTVRWGTKAEIHTPEVTLCGFIRWQVEYRTAEMVLNKNQPDDSLIHTIKHEELHLLFEGHKPKPVKYDAQYEFGLNAVSGIL